jgi:hypothetical protein
MSGQTGLAPCKKWKAGEIRRRIDNYLLDIVAEYIRAVNTFDTDAILATFAKDALVNDNHREVVGTAALRPRGYAQ